jgi:hypothetical protein
MLRSIRGIRKIHVNLPWYSQKSFNICLYIKRTIHRNLRPRLKELGGDENNIRKQKKSCNKLSKKCYQEEEHN